MKKFLLFTVFFIFLASVGWGQAGFTWTGAAGSTDWDDPDNWDGGSSPGNGEASCIIIINSSANDPVFAGTELECDTLIIQSGASLDMGEYSLTVDTLENYGNLILAGSGSQSVSAVNVTENDTVTFNAAGTNFAWLTTFNNLIIQDGDRIGVGAITVSGNFYLTGGSLNAMQINVDGISDIAGDITTTGGTQTYSGQVVLQGNHTLTGTTVSLGSVTGVGGSLTITGNGELRGGSGIGNLIVSGNFSLADGSLSAATVNITGTSDIAADITTTGNQTYTGAVTLSDDVNFTGNAGSTVRFDSTVNGTASAKDLTITDANVVFAGTVGSSPLSLIKSVTVTAGTAAINADISTTGNQIYNGAVTLGGIGTRILTSTSGGITTASMTGSGAVRLEAAGDININGDTSVSQLLMITSGIVNVSAVTITTTSTGNEGTSAAIYIKAVNFVVTSGANIVPGGSGGQLCLDLNTSWTDTYSVVDDVENVRWHQHYLNLTGKHLVYGTVPAGLTLGTYVHILDNDIYKTAFILESGYNVYINDANNSNLSGISFNTSGSGFIEFTGTNAFNKITLESGGGIRLVDTDVTITGDFELTHNEGITLSADSPPGTGSSINAANITLNRITTADNKDLNLTTTSGDIILNGNVGTNSAHLGDITIVSADKVTFSGDLFANSLDVTSVGVIIIKEDINTDETQTYNGNIELVGSRILTARKTAGLTINSTIEITGTVTGNANSLTIYANGVLSNGGTGINDFAVSGNFDLSGAPLSAAKIDINGTSNIAANITGTGNQTYIGEVIITGPVKRTITSINGNLEFRDKLGVNNTATDIIELVSESGTITVRDKIEAYQLIAKAHGNVTVFEIEIDSSNTGNEDLSAAIYIEADDFIVTGSSIIPGGKEVTQWGQLCLVLNHKWEDTNGVVDGDEDINPDSLSSTDFRWHQHFVDLHIVYGDGSTPIGYYAPDYKLVSHSNAHTIFTLGPDKNIYIYNAAITPQNSSGLTFKTSGTGYIEFGGTNVLQKLTYESDSGDIRLVDASVKINEGFELTHGETIKLITNSPPGTGNSIEAASITLNSITAENGESLTLKSISGDIDINGTVGTAGGYIGDLIVNSAGNAAFTENVYAESMDVTNAGTINIGANITTNADQTYSGQVELGGAGVRTLTGINVTLGTVTGNGISLTINGNGVLNGGSGINELIVTGTAAVNADITTAGNQTYTGEVTLKGPGIRTITSENGNLEFEDKLGVNTVTTDRIELSAADGNITVSGKIEAYQLIAKAKGIVTVYEIEINLSYTGNEGTSAAIYIQADDFIITSTNPDSIIPGGKGVMQWGQLCLVLDKKWNDPLGLVDGPEDEDSDSLTATGFRWHQHFVDLTGKHLVYGTTVPSGLALGTYVHILITDPKTTFNIDDDYNIYINDVSITPQNTSGLTFKTGGTGFIEFSGTNVFEQITLESGNGGIRLVDADITVTGSFELTHSERIGLLADSPPGTGSSINAANITLNSITTAGNKDLTLTSTSGDIVINGTVGTNSAYLGDITVVSADKVTFFGALFSNSLDVTSTGIINICANITTTGAQTYPGQVELGGAGTRTLIGTNVTLGTVTGNGNSLTITGNGVINGGSGINELMVSGTAAVNADITTTGNQTYTGVATLSGSDRKITSQNGNIEFRGALDTTDKTTDKIELSAVAGKITVSGKITAYQLIAKATGIVSVNAIEIDANTGNEGGGAAIYIVADTFVVTTTAPNSIIPGGTGGQLCLVVNKKWTDVNGVVDGPEDGEPLGTVPGARWHQHIQIIILDGKILYSFTEDSSGNGKLDRIRVQANVSLNGDFSGFDVSVQEYEIDRTKGVKGFQLVSAFTGAASFDDDSFYIYLIEKPEIDGGNTPLWSIIENESLTNSIGSKVGDPETDINLKPFDTIPPRIVYTLTLPGHPQTYLQVTEPVVSSSGADISASFGGLSVLSMNKIEPAGLGYLFNLSGSLKTEDLARDITSLTLDDGYFQIDAFDKGQKAEDLSVLDPDAQPPKYPLNWGYTAYAKVYNDGTIKDENGFTPLSDVFIPPNKLLTDGMTSNPRRVTDVLVSLTPANTNNDNYFVWPVWARFKKSLNDPYSAGNDVFWGQQPTDTGIIWQFDGTGYLETSFIETNDGIELQARINDNLSGSPVLFWTTADIPAEYRNPKEATEAKKTGGLWLPNALANPLYNYVPLSDNINGKPADSASSKLFVYNISKDLLVVDTNAKLEFIFRLSSTSDLFIARLDIPRGAVIPSDWYNYIRPFVFDIRNIRRQRGGVTIMNNVINSDKREITYIRYHLTRPGRVTVQIYTLDGTLVKSLRRNDQRDAGEWTDTWDGTNNGGRAVARGMYFVRVVGPEIDEIRKIMVVK